MSVAMNNPFHLLGVDGSEEAPAAQAASTGAGPQASKPKTQSAPAPAMTQRYVPGAPRQTAPKVPVSVEPLPRDSVEVRDTRGASRARGERGGGRGGDYRERGGRGGGRGGRGGRGSGRGGGRQFDRHSGTGREETEKSVRQGWGGVDGASAQKQEQGAKEDAKHEAEQNAQEDAADKKAEREAAQPEPEQDKTLTLDEYLKSQAEKRPQLAASAPRTVQEDESYGQRLDRGEGESYFAGTEKKTSAPRPRKEKQLVEIDPVYTSPSMSRGSGNGPRGGGRGGGRGGRGGARGGRGNGRGGRGSGRGGRSGGRGGNQGPVVNLADENAFPSLS